LPRTNHSQLTTNNEPRTTKNPPTTKKLSPILFRNRSAQPHTGSAFAVVVVVVVVVVANSMQLPKIRLQYPGDLLKPKSDQGRKPWNWLGNPTRKRGSPATGVCRSDPRMTHGRLIFFSGCQAMTLGATQGCRERNAFAIFRQLLPYSTSEAQLGLRFSMLGMVGERIYYKTVARALDAASNDALGNRMARMR